MVEPTTFGDERGWFMEVWNGERYGAAGLPASFRQTSMSFSQRGVLRGLHFQNPHAQGKLVCALQGEVLDVAVDVRVGSPGFGRSVAVRLDARARHQIYIPEGFAHGFCVLSESALVSYHSTEVYRPADEAGILWNDPDLGIAWPLEGAVVSPRDAAFPRLRDLPRERLPHYRGA